jgi:hypothetical protein
MRARNKVGIGVGAGLLVLWVIGAIAGPPEKPSSPRPRPLSSVSRTASPRLTPSVMGQAPPPKTMSPSPSPAPPASRPPAPVRSLATTPAPPRAVLSPPRPSSVPPLPPPQAAPVALCGAPPNPDGLEYCAGSLVTSPPQDVCNYFTCIANFWNGRGYMVECKDTEVSMSGGIRGACSYHHGELRPVYKH